MSIWSAWRNVSRPVGKRPPEASGSFSNVPDTAIVPDPGIYLLASLAVAAVGCLVGAVELLYLNRRLAKRSLGVKLVAKTLFYAALLTGVILITFPVAAAMEMTGHTRQGPKGGTVRPGFGRPSARSIEA